MLHWHGSNSTKHRIPLPTVLFSMCSPTLNRTVDLEAPVQIIYASRTHSQLAQAVKEFKTTDYKCVHRSSRMMFDLRCLDTWRSLFWVHAINCVFIPKWNLSRIVPIKSPPAERKCIARRVPSIGTSKVFIHQERMLFTLHWILGAKPEVEKLPAMDIEDLVREGTQKK